MRVSIECPAERNKFKDKDNGEMVYGASLIVPGAKVFAKVSETQYAALPPGRFEAICDVEIEGNKNKIVGVPMNVRPKPQKPVDVK